MDAQTSIQFNTVNLTSRDKPLILVVDDDWMNREVMQANLDAEGYAVSEAHSGEQALEMVASRLPDLILLDAVLPGMSGYDVCRSLKNNSATRHIPVVMLTALAEDKDRQAAIEAGVDYFTTKSLSTTTLLSRIRTLLDARG